MTASALCFRTAVVFAIAGMAMGIAMAASHDHSVMPAHAHLNLLGWVSLFLIGIYYKFKPSMNESRVALIQVGLWVIGTVVLTTGVAAIYLGYAFGEPVATVGSLIILAGMVDFATLAFRTAPESRATGTMAAAEEPAR